MKFDETKRLIGYISGFDNRALSEMTATSWTDVLEDVSFDAAKAVVKEFFTTPGHGYLEVTDILVGVQRRTRNAPDQIEADVRSAKARGLIEQTWGRMTRLPAEVAERLAQARDTDMRALFGIEDRVIENPVAFDAGQIGRDVPNA